MKSAHNSQRRRLRESIPMSLSEELLQSWGYDLVDEYLQIVQQASLHPHDCVLELATGTGRMTAVLTRLGFHVTTGDLTAEKHQQAFHRVSSEYRDRIQLLLLDMEMLPFRNASASSITCVNTLHELERPQLCLSELLRIHNPRGTLILGDFTETGFEAMQEVHRVIYGNDHPRGSLKITGAESIIRQTYSSVETVVTPLNITYIASRKK